MCDGSLLVQSMAGELRIKRYRKSPKPHLEDLQAGRRDEIPVHDDGTSLDGVFGVITYLTNDTRTGEFEGYPVMQESNYSAMP